MIQESSVLLGVKHLEQRTRGISIVSTSNLVDLVNEYQRVFRPDALQCLDDLARKSSGRCVESHVNEEREE